ncbi:type VI secretion system tip protein TssI/VgrG [Sphingomonas sp. ASY06-1R]|uniref:type VI secretion system tip protein TssI/VgrG n=1 Tax=Sphingomonas sp. ASY06-1R TaxID=3445771 RepID=UPI003FA2A03D
MARFPNRFLHLIEAPGSVDNYKLFRMDGTEKLSEPFSFELTIRSQGQVPKAESWIGASITFSFGQTDGAERTINGRCSDFRHLHEKGSYVEFFIRVQPAFESLKMTRDRRIFNDKSAKQVVETVLGEHNIAFDDAKWGNSPVRSYIVQHDESDFALVSRMMEDEGVFYYFKYDEGAAPYKHRMIIAGDPSGYYDGEPFEINFRRDHLTRGLNSLQMGYGSAPSKVVTHDYNYKQPGELTPVTAPSRLSWAEKKGQVFQWGAGYKDPSGGQSRANLRVEGAESGSVNMKGQGTYSAFAPGARFSVNDQRLEPWERRIVVSGVRHSVFDPYASDEGEPYYKQQFEAHPSAQPFRPPQSTPRAISSGPQTAVVLDQNDGKGLGRVKVRFHWDHSGHSSCWVRVLQQWGGNQIGSQFIPRPGMEVLVDFIDGRAENPVIIGCLYNGKNKHGFDLPANLTQAGWRTSGEGGKTNHLLFEDKGGGEKIDLLAGRDFVRTVNRHESVSITEHLEIAAKAVDIAATESIVLHVGGSKITITSSGVWIDADKIQLNSGGAPTTFTPQIQPALPAPTGATSVGAASSLAGGGGSGPSSSSGGGSGGAAANPGGSSGGGAGAGGGTGGGTPKSEALAKSITKPGGTGTQADVDAVVGELKKMPEPALQTLKDNKVDVIAARGSVTDFASDLKGVKPRGWPPGSSWDSVPGAFMPDRNAVVIATRGDATNRSVPLTGNGHGSENLVVHEVTHAVDKYAGAARNSQSPDFVAARLKDVAALPSYETQPGVAGLSETYAESAARAYGGSHGSIVTPALDSYWAANPLGGK